MLQHRSLHNALARPLFHLFLHGHPTPLRQPRFAVERTEGRFCGNVAGKTAISAKSPAAFRGRTHRRPILWKRGGGDALCRLSWRRFAAFLAPVCGVFGAGLRPFWREFAETLQTGATAGSVWLIPGAGMQHSGRPAPSKSQTNATAGSVWLIPGTGPQHSGRPAKPQLPPPGNIRPRPGEKPFGTFPVAEKVNPYTI